MVGGLFPETRWFALSFRELRVLLLAAILLLGGIGLARIVRSFCSQEALSVEQRGDLMPEPARLDVNTARAYELALLPGIGRKIADAIVEYREKQGPFKSLAELDKVPRIGPKTIERLHPHLMCVPVEGAGESRDRDRPRGK